MTPPKTENRVKVRRIGSLAREKPGAKFAMIGLGLGGRRMERTLEDTPAVRGMMRRAAHLIRIVDAAEKS